MSIRVGGATNTKSGTFPIPSTGHDFQGSTNYQIVLTVTDSTGLSASTSVTIFPDKVNSTFNTSPSGLNVEIDGITKQTPFVLDDLKGFQHTINAPNQSSDGTSYTFASWSDSGAQSHSIVVPNSDQSRPSKRAQGHRRPLPRTRSTKVRERASRTSTGTGNSGTIGSTTWTTAGKFGKALSFNGTSARVTVNDAPSLRSRSRMPHRCASRPGMTLEAWVYPIVVSSAWRDVVYKGDDNYYLSATSTKNSGRPAGGGTIGNKVADTFGTSVLPVNTWSHLAVTYDGAALRFVVNGTQVSSSSRTGTIRTSTQALDLGGDSIYGQFFSGRIDDVRVFTAAWSAAQVQTDMNTRRLAATVRTRGPRPGW